MLSNRQCVMVGKRKYVLIIYFDVNHTVDISKGPRLIFTYLQVPW